MKVLCVGQNYARHVREMGGPAPAGPVWFWKPASAIIGSGEAIVVPPDVGAVHHEVELAVRIGTRARRLLDAHAGRSCIDAFTVAIDVTARDLQAAAKRDGRPWAQAKGFDTFLPLGPWQDAPTDLQDLRLRLWVDDALRQDGRTNDMTWTAGELVHLASQWTTLEPGDVLLTGTPEGVGPILPGQSLISEVTGHVRMANRVSSMPS